MTRALLAVVLALQTFGCGARITPPARVLEPRTVFLQTEARHSSIVLPNDDGRWVEYTYGDWHWFALIDTRWQVAVRAMLGSPQATFGRRTYPSHPESLTVTLRPIVVESSRVRALRTELEARFSRRAEASIYNAEYGIWFVPDDERYHVFNNCNHLTARWLRRLGCQVSGWSLTNRFSIDKRQTSVD
jgi:hypothetical protein